jgi:hypothetical protein
MSGTSQASNMDLRSKGSNYKIFASAAAAAASNKTPSKSTVEQTQAPSPARTSTLSKENGENGKLTQLSINKSQVNSLVYVRPSQDDSLIPPGQPDPLNTQGSVNLDQAISTGQLTDPNDKEMIKTLEGNCQSNSSADENLNKNPPDHVSIIIDKVEDMVMVEAATNHMPDANDTQVPHNIGNPIDGSTNVIDKNLSVPPPPLRSQYQFSFQQHGHGLSVSESGLPTNTPIDAQTIDANKWITDLIIQRTKEIDNQKDREVESRPTEMEIHLIKSDEIMNINITPFTHEGELPNFEHGSIANHYFTNLRTILGKCTRAQIQSSFVKECLSRKIIPKGFKLNKPLMAVDPSPKLRLAHYKITTQAETQLMQAVVEHHITAIPKLMNEFTEYFDEVVQLISATDRRLLVLRLIKYKNGIIEEKAESQGKKMQRDTNIPASNRSANPGPSRNPQPYEPQSRNRPQYRDNGGPAFRQNRNPSPGFRNQRQYQDDQGWQRKKGSNQPQARASRNQNEWEDYEIYDEEDPNEYRGGRFNQPPPKEQRQPRQRGPNQQGPRRF